MTDRSIERGAKALDEMAAETYDQRVLSDEEVDARIADAAAWPSLKYERERLRLAQRLGMRVGELDKLVAGRRTGDVDAAGGAEGMPFADVVPATEPVSPATVLDAVKHTILRFVVLTQMQAMVCALWIVLTHLTNRMTLFPMLAITSPEKGCGKSSLLGVLMRLTARPIMASNISPAAVYRVIDKFCPTLLIDEADTFLGINDELRGILNSGHTRDTAYVFRCVGDDFDPQPFKTFCGKAIALIGKLPDTLAARSIPIGMRRKAPEETAENLRHADPAVFEQQRSWLARFAADFGEAFAAARPVIPDELRNRLADNAEPLLAIADLAGGTWSSEARKALLQLGGAESESPSVAQELLEHLRRAQAHFGLLDPNGDRIETASLLPYLCADDEARWKTHNRGKEMTPRQLAQFLTPFGISPQVRRSEGRPRRGYLWADFQDAFARYLPPLDVTAQPASAHLARGVSGTTHVALPAVTPASPVAARYATQEPSATPEASPDGGGNGVTGPTQGEGEPPVARRRSASKRAATT